MMDKLKVAPPSEWCCAHIGAVAYSFSGRELVHFHCCMSDKGNVSISVRTSLRRDAGGIVSGLSVDSATCAYGGILDINRHPPRCVLVALVAKARVSYVNAFARIQGPSPSSVTLAPPA